MGKWLAGQGGQDAGYRLEAKGGRDEGGLAGKVRVRGGSETGWQGTWYAGIVESGMLSGR